MAVPQRRLADFSTLLVAMAMSLEKFENTVLIHRKALSYSEKIVNIGSVHLEIFDEICRTTTSSGNAISIRIFSSETTGPIFTIFYTM